MNINKKFSKIADHVEYLLQSDDKYKDNDEQLIARIWSDELGGINAVKEITAFDFICRYATGKVTPADSVTRCRRKIQELYPEMRGIKWKERQTKLQSESVEEIRNF